jgi:hypothetical protein
MSKARRPACDVAETLVFIMAEKARGSVPVTIRGLIVPMDWDDRGNITGVAISTPFEEEYRIELDQRGEELLAFVRARVTATGVVTLDAQGRKVIMVESYQIVE